MCLPEFVSWQDEQKVKVTFSYLDQGNLDKYGLKIGIFFLFSSFCCSFSFIYDNIELFTCTVFLIGILIDTALVWFMYMDCCLENSL